jgi:hypothetical protein
VIQQCCGGSQGVRCAARPLIAACVAVALGRAIPLATGWYDTGLGGDHVSFWPLAWGAVLVLVMTLPLRRQAVL